MLHVMHVIGGIMRDGLRLDLAVTRAVYSSPPVVVLVVAGLAVRAVLWAAERKRAA